MSKKGRPKGIRYRKVTLEDMKAIAEFNRVVKSYKKMQFLIDKSNDTERGQDNS